MDEDKTKYIHSHLATGNRLPRENIGPTARIFDIRVWLALDGLDDFKARLLEKATHLRSLKEDEIEGDPFSKQFVEVENSVADVESQEQ